MLKKVIIGFLCFIILAVTGAGIYIYTLDWNQHKDLVATRFSEITGLKADIDGDLNVEIFPSPKFTAKKVRFSKQTAIRDPLIIVSEITATVDLMGLLNKKFSVRSMTLVGAIVNVNISEKGDLNWSNVGKNSSNSSGNIEVSFNDIRLSSSTFHYKNNQDQEEFEITGISASVSAPSLKGPYQTNGRFNHNNSEVKFNGSIRKDANITLNMAVENAATGSKAKIEGTFGANAKGLFTFDTQHLSDVAAVMFGENALPEHYNASFYLSFHYDYDDAHLNLDKFNITHGEESKGVGSVLIEKLPEKKKITASLDMVQFNLDLLENIGSDILRYVQSGQKFSETLLGSTQILFNLKSGQGVFRNASAKDINLAWEFDNGIFTLNRLLTELPGDTNIKIGGIVNFNDNFAYDLDSTLDTSDLRVFASILGLDLSKLASQDNKKGIFKKASAHVNLKGLANSLEVSVNDALIDSTEFKGKLGFIKNEDKVFSIADISASKILFDKYIDLVPDNLSGASFKDKVIYQLNLIPWSHDIDVQAKLDIASAVYNKIPLENISLEAHLAQDTLKINKFNVENLAGAAVSMQIDAEQIYTDPQFKELSFDVKTTNFPSFTSTLGIKTGDQPLFKSKLFAVQGALSGGFNDVKISSIQKFDDAEFTYTGLISDINQKPLVDGDIELKSSNFTRFVKSLNINYSPDMPVTTFNLSGKIKGSADLFELSNINSHLGANAITGTLTSDSTAEKPKIAAQLTFDKFDADRLFSLNKRDLFPDAPQGVADFIAQPVLSDKKIDYSTLKSVDFDIQALMKSLVYQNKNYINSSIDAVLIGGALNVRSFKAEKDNTLIDLSFILNSNDMPKIDGQYKVSDAHLPDLGGNVYELEGGAFSAHGTFSSLASSQKDFMDNLTSQGNFNLESTSFRGWDLDIIKFELEQSQNVNSFKENVTHNLQSGVSVFSKVSGQYEITKGVLTANNIVWVSPVANLNMNISLNLSDWEMNTSFQAGYHNASFPDVLKFSYSGNMARPVLQTDLEESIARIQKSENTLLETTSNEKLAQQAKLSGKINELKNQIEALTRSVSRLSFDVVRYKPVTDNESVISVYDDNLELIQQSENSLKDMQTKLETSPSEQDLMSIEAELASLKSKLQSIPKTLEDNYIVESKYIYDDTFNKIAWVFNVARNNSSFYLSLTEAYIAQLNLLEESGEGISEDKREELLKEIQSVNEDMERIQALHNKIRESYLSIVDTVSVNEMKGHNKVAKQALETILASTERMNTKIVNSIDNFRVVLNVSSRDYDQFMVYVPQSIDDIDVSQPTTRTETKVKEDTKQKNEPSSLNSESSLNDEEAQKKNDTLGSLTPGKGLSSLITEVKDNLLVSNIGFSGLSDILSKAKSVISENAETKEDDNKTDVVVADADIKEEPAVEITEPQDISVPLQNDVSQSSAQEIKEDTFEQPVLSQIEEEIQTDDTTPIVVADTKADESISVDVADAQTVDDNQKEFPISSENASSESKGTLFSYAKSAFENLMSGVKRTEKSIHSMLFSEEKEPQPEPLETAQQDIPLPEKTEIAPTVPLFTGSVLKTNPVIALDLAEDTQPEVTEEVMAQEHVVRTRKGGFKKNKISDETSVIATSSDLLNETEPKTSEQSETASLSNESFLAMITEENEKSSVSGTSLSQRAFIPETIVLSSVEMLDDNHYVFAIESNLPRAFNGEVGREHQRPKIRADLGQSESNVYLFAMNDRPQSISGSVHKRLSLYAK